LLDSVFKKNPEGSAFFIVMSLDLIFHHRKLGKKNICTYSDGAGVTARWE